jgi:hypothetical protein
MVYFDSEDLTATFTIIARNNGCIYINEIVLFHKYMDSINHLTSYSQK